MNKTPITLIMFMFSLLFFATPSLAYFEQVQPSLIDLHFTMDDCSSSIVHDSGPFGINEQIFVTSGVDNFEGSDVILPCVNKTVLGRSVSFLNNTFDGVLQNNIRNRSAEIVLENATAWTVCSYIEYSAFANYQFMVLSQANDGSNIQGAIYMYDDGYVRLPTFNDAPVVSSFPLQLDVPYLICTAYDGAGGGYIYINGTLAASSNDRTIAALGGNPKSELSVDYYGQENTAYIGETALWRTNLTAAEIAQLATEPSPDTTPPTFTEIPSSFTTTQGTPVYIQYNATDDTAIDTFSINDANFTITTNGLFTNATALNIANYTLNISVNDTSNNIATQEITINIESACIPNWQCTAYTSCSINNTQTCNSVTDTNSCSIAYTGNYTEFFQPSCDYYATQSGYCFQESATTPNQTGKDGDCGLNYNGSYTSYVTSTSRCPTNSSFDGNYITGCYPRNAADYAQIDAVYAEPTNSIIGAVFSYYTGNTYNANISNNDSYQSIIIPAECISPGQISISTNTTNNGDSTNTRTITCFNGTDNINIQSRIVLINFQETAFKEDRIYWQTTPCMPSYVCNGYASCGITDNASCNSVTDTNFCGIAYAGNYSEFTPSSCNYCTSTYSGPEYWACTNATRNVGYTYTNTCCATTGLTSDCTAPSNQTGVACGFTPSYTSTDVAPATINTTTSFFIALGTFAVILTILGTFYFSRIIIKKNK